MASSIRAIDTLLEPFGTRANVDPRSLPWTALNTLITSVYASKVGETDVDSKILSTFVNTLFTPNAFDLEEIAPGLAAPDGSKIESFVRWADALPALTPAASVGLLDSAEEIVTETRGPSFLLYLGFLR
jgi:dynein heavy chain 1